MAYHKHKFTIGGTLAEFRIFALKYTDLEVCWMLNRSGMWSTTDPDDDHQVVIYPNPRYDVGPDGEIEATALQVGREVIVTVNTTSLDWLNRAKQLELDAQAKFTLPPEDFGKARLPSYNLAMAKQIADAIPLAWEAKGQDSYFETKYNNKTIANEAGIVHETVSRYLGVFRDYGITHIHGITLPKAGRRKPRQ